MDLTFATTILVALFTGHTIIAWKDRGWYYKISKYFFASWYLCFGFIIGYHIASATIWNKVKSFDPDYFRQADDLINSYLPSINWYVLLAITLIYLTFLHHVIWRIKYRKKKR